MFLSLFLFFACGEQAKECEPCPKCPSADAGDVKKEIATIWTSFSRMRRRSLIYKTQIILNAAIGFRETCHLAGTFSGARGEKFKDIF